MKPRLEFLVIADKTACYLIEQCGDVENCVAKYNCFLRKKKPQGDEKKKKTKPDITKTRIYKKAQREADELNAMQNRIHGGKIK